MLKFLAAIALFLAIAAGPAFAGSGHSTETESMTNGAGEDNASDEGLLHGAVDNCAA